MNKKIKPDKSWTLFLDRDGVINKRLKDDYVKNIKEFEFIDHVPESLKELSEIFGKIIVVTNQQGIGKGLMSDVDLADIHNFMYEKIAEAGGNIDKIYYCSDLDNSGSKNRKPDTGMGLKAKKEFPCIDFCKSIMVGDTLSDMKFGRNLSMFTVLLSENNCYLRLHKNIIDKQLPSIKEFLNWIKKDNLQHEI